MKRIIAILVMLMLVPFTAFGLEALSEDVMDNVTGQAGVSIATDININMTMDTLAWGDSDGIDASATDNNAGWVGLKNLNVSNLRIRLDDNLLATPGQIKLFSIDVATGTKTIAGTDVANTTYVRMGIGSQHITMTSMTADVELGAANSLGQQMGNFAMLNFSMIFDGASYVDIYANPAGSGVVMDLDITIKEITMDALSWGDTGGANGGGLDAEVIGFMDAPLQAAVTTTGGYIGLANLAITNLTVEGQVMIDVATIDPAAVVAAETAHVHSSGLIGVYASMLGAGYDGGATGVLIRLNNLNIGMGSFAADVVLASDAALTTKDLGAGNAGELGKIYMENMQVNVNGWVGIFAH